MRIGDRAQHDEKENLPCMAVKQGVRKTKTLRVLKAKKCKSKEMNSKKEKKKIKENNNNN